MSERGVSAGKRSLNKCTTALPNEPILVPQAGQTPAVTDGQGAVLGAFSILAFAKEFNVGRTTIYREIGEGRLRAKKIGRRTLITREDAKEWLSNLARVAARAQPTSDTHTQLENKNVHRRP